MLAYYTLAKWTPLPFLRVGITKYLNDECFT